MEIDPVDNLFRGCTPFLSRGNEMAAPKTQKKRKVENYTHPKEKRVNNPPVGLVTPKLDRDRGKKNYTYDPHLDSSLQWAGKAERTSFEIPTLSLHVHERIDPRSIIEAVRSFSFRLVSDHCLTASGKSQRWGEHSDKGSRVNSMAVITGRN
jgi:hypothetical protein